MMEGGNKYKNQCSYQPIVSQNLDKKNKYKFANIAVDLNGENIAISSERGLFILNLPNELEDQNINILDNTTIVDSNSSNSNNNSNNSNNTGTFKKLKSQTKDVDYDLIAWNKNPSESHLLIASSSKDYSINLWNVKDEKLIVRFSKTHIRHITSLSWNLQETNIVASASSDCMVNIFDIRERTQGSGGISTNFKAKSNLSQVSWNAKGNMLATSNGGEFNIWDIRKFGSPLSCISAHIGSISSIEWSLKEKNQLVTCAPNDKCIKVWDVSPPGKLLHNYHVGSNCNIAKFVPFIDNQIIGSISTKGSYNDIQFWTNDKSLPILSLSGGHKDSILNFDWRTVEKSDGTKQHYITSIGKDNQFNMWKVTDDIINTFNTASSNTTKDSPSKLILPNNIRISQESQDFLNKMLSNDIEDSTDEELDQQQQHSSNSNNNNKILTPTITTTKSSMSNNRPLDLHQELGGIIQEKFEYITFEKLSLSDRICAVNVDNRKFVVFILFPFLYPAATPSFDILFGDSTAFTTDIKIKLKKKLDKLSSQLKDKKKPFLLQLLELISSFYKSIKSQFPEDLNPLDSPKIQQRIPKNQPSKRFSLNSPVHESSNIGTPVTIHPLSPVILSSDSNSSNSSPSTLSPMVGSNNDSNITERSRSQSASINLAQPNIDGSNNNNNINNLLVGVNSRARSGSIGSKMTEPPNMLGNNTNQLYCQYTVKPNDTLTGISLQFSMPRDLLIQTNRLLHSEKLLKPGTQLWVYKKKNLDSPNSLNEASEQQSTVTVSLESLDINQSSSSGGIGGSGGITGSGGVTNNNSNGSNSSYRNRAYSSGSQSLNINDLFKPSKDEIKMAFNNSPTNDSSNISNSSSLKPPMVPFSATSRFTRISKESIVKEKLVLFMRNQKVVGHITLTPYQLIFQSIIEPGSNSKSVQIYADYPHIISCKYLFDKSEWLAHFSKDWYKEQRYIKDKISKGINGSVGNGNGGSNDSKSKSKIRSKKEEEEHDSFIQKEISKLNEMEEEKTLLQDDVTKVYKKVLVFPCIYAIIHKDNSIQTVFFRGSDATSVHTCFSYLKQLIVDSKFTSPLNSSPILSAKTEILPPPIEPLVTTNSTNTNATTTTTTTTTTTPSIPITFSASKGWRGSSNNIRSLVSSGENDLTSSFDENYNPPPKLLKDQTKYIQEEIIIMTPEIYKKIRHYLPLRIQCSDIELIYNTTNDGVSFSTFFRKIKPFEQSIMLIKDENGYVFGAFLSDRVEPKKDVFFGSGETFVFKIYPQFDIYRWSKENDMFIYASNDYISIGGGSSFGIWMNTNFHNGFTGPCETFNNDKLSCESDFYPHVVEIWGICN